MAANLNPITDLLTEEILLGDKWKIKRCEVRKGFNEENKLVAVVQRDNITKVLYLNKESINNIAQVLGQDTDDWLHDEIQAVERKFYDDKAYVIWKGVE